MSRLDEPTDPASRRFSASLTVRAHDEGRRCCASCPGPDGDCGQEVWARDELRGVDMPSPGLPPHRAGE